MTVYKTRGNWLCADELKNFEILKYISEKGHTLTTKITDGGH